MSAKGLRKGRKRATPRKLMKTCATAALFDAIEDLKDRLDAMENAVYITEATLTDSTTRN